MAASHRQGRQWQRWPWGWLALAASIAAWLCMAVMVVLFTASIGMPGDGNQAMQATWVPMLITWMVAAISATGGLIAGPVALRLARQPGAAVLALVLLLLLLLVGLSLLGLMA
ncbi:hypothetical protein XOC_2795 [Xanthomonas oryzae pv. oryzicola BLS256]|uniref:Uncharacterized protein n=1 Tax=Xanthomonas oryzae pv. oryzicola (strain BLS256) TaxID=383407 RepID=G7TJ83_XANOB|nr:hypothetical protein XOC_2795 [Xanthomonas oryzae pv. oryzicola BLS256]